ncbi:MAG: hypothetical protein ACFHWZ_13805 [Phycisphaerales bacterium]
MSVFRIRLMLALSALALPAAASHAAPPTVDGCFEDWNRDHIVAVDPAGDASGAFDVTTLSAQFVGEVLHLRFDTGRTLNIQSGPDGDGTLVLEFTSGNVALRINTRERSVNRLTGSQQVWQDVGWHAVGYWSANVRER